MEQKGKGDSSPVGKEGESELSYTVVDSKILIDEMFRELVGKITSQKPIKINPNQMTCAHRTLSEMLKEEEWDICDGTTTPTTVETTAPTAPTEATSLTASTTAPLEDNDDSDFTVLTSTQLEVPDSTRFRSSTCFKLKMSYEEFVNKYIPGKWNDEMEGIEHVFIYELPPIKYASDPFAGVTWMGNALYLFAVGIENKNSKLLHYNVIEVNTLKRKIIVYEPLKEETFLGFVYGNPSYETSRKEIVTKVKEKTGITEEEYVFCDHQNVFLRFPFTITKNCGEYAYLYILCRLFGCNPETMKFS